MIPGAAKSVKLGTGGPWIGWLNWNNRYNMSKIYNKNQKDFLSDNHN